MTTKDIAITLAVVLLGGTLALAQNLRPQVMNTSLDATRLDRCPYYPSPVFCRSESQSGEPNEIAHNAGGR
jgi:hypothetical protein